MLAIHYLNPREALLHTHAPSIYHRMGWLWMVMGWL